MMPKHCPHSCSLSPIHPPGTSRSGRTGSPRPRLHHHRPHAIPWGGTGKVERRMPLRRCMPGRSLSTYSSSSCVASPHPAQLCSGQPPWKRNLPAPRRPAGRGSQQVQRPAPPAPSSAPRSCRQCRRRSTLTSRTPRRRGALRPPAAVGRRRRRSAPSHPSLLSPRRRLLPLPGTSPGEHGRSPRRLSLDRRYRWSWWLNELW
mmetsp:Transcript_26491/g.57123  ORF Transcript_26491/g.57123 Transcript_26491/m.57123 type:complete len:203 (-) Transcript_26491:56-664(-)